MKETYYHHGCCRNRLKAKFHKINKKSSTEYQIKVIISFNSYAMKKTLDK